MVQTIALQHTLLHCKAEADQFIEGFKVLGVLSAIREHCNLLMPFYTNKTTKLTPDDIRELLADIKFSEKGSSARQKEEATYIYFIDYLEECERATEGQETVCEGIVDLPCILNFFSGANEVPPQGFPFTPRITFNSDNIYPTASTCAVELTLPTKYHLDYQCFKNALDYGFLNHGGFGLF